MEGSLNMGGALSARLIRTRRAPISWMLRNYLRWGFIKAWLGVMVFGPLANAFGLMTAYGELRAVLIKGDTGERIDYGVLSYRVITDTGVQEMAKDFKDGTGEVTNFKYHGTGTGAGAEAAANTALTTECTTALNPDSTRATGTNTNPTNPTYRSIGTLTFDADAAVIEHGIFSQAATGGGILWDRSIFAAINVVGANGDSIQFTYTLTLTSGG